MSVAVTCCSAGGVGEQLLGAVVQVGVVLVADVAGAVLEVEVEAGAEALMGTGSSVGAGCPSEAALGSAALLKFIFMMCCWRCLIQSSCTDSGP